MSALSLKDVRKSFSGNQILKGVSFDAGENEFIALVGPFGMRPVGGGSLGRIFPEPD